MVSNHTDGSAPATMPHFPQPDMLQHERRNLPRHDSGWARRRAAQSRHAHQLARGLGWFSIGLGLAQLIAPRTIARGIGIEQDYRLIMRAIGLRELVCGAAILGNEKPAGWLWSRSGGDLMDLGLLALAARAPANDRRRLALAGLAVTGVAALDVFAAEQDTRSQRRAGAGLRELQAAVSVNRPPAEVYRFWRQLENLPLFMRDLDAVEQTGPRHSHWRARLRGGRSIEWDAELTIDQPGQMLAWRSLEGADMLNFGVVRFESAGGGHATTVHLEMHYSPPGGVFGALFARLPGQNPDTQMESNLRRFKQLLETGEIPTTEGQSAGRRSLLVWLLHRRAGVFPEPQPARLADGHAEPGAAS